MITDIQQINEWIGLDRYVEKARDANAELAASIITYGICARQAWIQDPMKVDALGKVAQYVIDKVPEMGAEAVLAELTHRYDNEASYIIPTNSDTAAAIYEVQALQQIRNEMLWAVEKLNEDK